MDKGLSRSVLETGAISLFQLPTFYKAKQLLEGLDEED